MDSFDTYEQVIGHLRNVFKTSNVPRSLWNCTLVLSDFTSFAIYSEFFCTNYASFGIEGSEIFIDIKRGRSP